MGGDIWEIQSRKGRMINKNDDYQSAEKRLADMSHELAQKRKSRLADFKNLLNQSASILQESIEEQQEGSGMSYDRSINLYSSAKKPNKTSSELAQGRKENLADLKNLVNKASAVVKMSPDQGKGLLNNRKNEESAGSDMRSPSYFIKKDKDENPFPSANKITAQPTTSLFGGPVIVSGHSSQPSNQTGIFQGVIGNGNQLTSGMSEGLFKTKPMNQPENFQIDNSVAGERSPSRIQVSLDKQEESVNLVSDDSQVNQQSRTEGFSPEKKEATLRASLQARDIGKTKQICEEIADLKNMFLTFMEQIGGMQPNVSDFSISNCSTIKEDDVKRQNDLMKTDTKNHKLGVGLFGNTAFTPSQTRNL